MKENNEYFNQRIGCSVLDCKFHDQENHCMLGKILISGQNRKEQTYCASFENRN